MAAMQAFSYIRSHSCCRYKYKRPRSLHLKAFHDESSEEIAASSVCYVQKKPRDLEILEAMLEKGVSVSGRATMGEKRSPLGARQSTTWTTAKTSEAHFAAKERLVTETSENFGLVLSFEPFGGFAWDNDSASTVQRLAPSGVSFGLCEYAECANHPRRDKTSPQLMETSPTSRPPPGPEDPTEDEHPDAGKFLPRRIGETQLFDLVLCDGQVLPIITERPTCD
jgi:hypothetical protein